MHKAAQLSGAFLAMHSNATIGECFELLQACASHGPETESDGHERRGAHVAHHLPSK